MNNSDSNKTFKPKQALAPTPQLYDELVGDGIENLAEAGSVLLDLGCGTGAGTSAIVGVVPSDTASAISIKDIDINEAALGLYKKKAGEHGWPA